MIATEIGLSRVSTKTIMEQHLGMQKMLARWVPHQLSDAQKQTRINLCTELLARWSHRWSRFRSRLITVDETWISYEQPATRQSASGWRPAGSEPPELARLQKDRRKLMAIVFWDAEGLVHIDWFKSTKSQPGLDKTQYVQILDRLYEKLRRDRPGKLARGVLLLQDNAPCHNNDLVRQKLQQLGIQTVPHLPYSPDLAPSDYYLFRVWKQSRSGVHSNSEEEIKSDALAFFESKSSGFYREGIDQLKQKCEAVIACRGSYV